LDQIIYPIFPTVLLSLFALVHYNFILSEYRNKNIQETWFRLRWCFRSCTNY